MPAIAAGAAVLASSAGKPLLQREHATGQFGLNGSSNLLINDQQVKSDGYQAYNKQKRDAASLKYRYQLGDDTAVTVFSSYLNLQNITPSIKGVTRANVEQGDYNTLLSGDPGKANYDSLNAQTWSAVPLTSATARYESGPGPSPCLGAAAIPRCPPRRINAERIGTRGP